MYKAVSDWKAKENYIYPKDTSMQRWAFEFLRRNNDYQKDVQSYIEICDSIITGFNPFLPPDMDSKQLASCYCELELAASHCYYDPPMIEGETVDQWLDRVGGGKVTNLNTWLAEKWGLCDLFYPYAEYDYISVSFINTASKVTIAGRGWFESEKTKLVSTSDKQAFVIDYKLPIPQQLAAIKRYAANHKKRLMKECDLKPMPNKRNRSNLFSIYLRCLDAAAAGISSSEMAKIFCPKKRNEHPDYLGTKTIGDWLDAAQKLRDHNYIYLPLIK